MLLKINNNRIKTTRIAFSEKIAKESKIAQRVYVLKAIIRNLAFHLTSLLFDPSEAFANKMNVTNPEARKNSIENRINKL